MVPGECARRLPGEDRRRAPGEGGLGQPPGEGQRGVPQSDARGRADRDRAGHACRTAHHVVAWCDGILFNATAGSGQAQPPSEQELREQTELMLRTLLVS